MYSTELRHYHLPKGLAHVFDKADKYIETMKYAGKSPSRVTFDPTDYNKIAESIGKQTNGERALHEMTYRGVPVASAGALR